MHNLGLTYSKYKSLKKSTKLCTNVAETSTSIAKQKLGLQTIINKKQKFNKLTANMFSHLIIPSQLTGKSSVVAAVSHVLFMPNGLPSLSIFDMRQAT